MSWVIYKHTNKINGKCYIGQTCQDPKLRWDNGLGYTLSDTHFSRAIKKYGWDNFEHEIIEENILSVEEANKREIYWIKYYNSYFDGYNSTIGGSNYLGNRGNKGVLQLNMQSLEIVNSFDSICEAARSLSVYPGSIGACCRREQSSAYGFYWCFKKDYLNFEPREFELNYVSVLMLDKDDFHIIRKFKSLQEAADFIHTNHSNIMNVCKRKHTTSCGYTWCYEKDYFDGWSPKEKEVGKHDCKKVICYETKIIYDSENDAARGMNTSVGNIHTCIKHPDRTIKGNHFLFLSDYSADYVPPMQNTNERRIYCFENQKVYNNISECSNELNINSSQIIGVCTGKEKTAKRMHFCYFEDKDKFILQQGKQREILCIETGIIYSSHKEAFETTKIRHINECCKGQCNSAGGFHWCYLDEKDVYEIKSSSTKKQVLCVETNECFPSLKDAALHAKVHPSTLGEAIKNQTPSGENKYHWKYVE